MANPRQRRKAKSGLKVSRKARSVNLRRIVINEPTIQAAWDSTKTVQENFKTIGLVNKLNNDIGSSQMRRNVLAWNSNREKVLEDISEIKAQAAEKAAKEGVLDMTPLDLGEEAIFGQLNTIFESTESTEYSVVRALESKSSSAAVNTKKAVKKLGQDDTEYIEALMKKHGKNTTAMARDIKLNYNQHTPNKLENMIEIYSLNNQ
jgi:nucleolar protein 16